jgi:hypothetical protein
VVVEILCRTGVIDRLTMQPPSEMLRDLVVLLGSGKMNGAMVKTLANVAIAATLAVVFGVAVAVAIHGYRAVRQGLSRCSPPITRSRLVAPGKSGPYWGQGNFDIAGMDRMIRAKSWSVRSAAMSTGRRSSIPVFWPTTSSQSRSAARRHYRSSTLEFAAL